MNLTTESKKGIHELEDVINRALTKVGAKKENDLSQYIPMTSGGYMHHFTLKKMKAKQPQELKAMLEKFILHSEQPGKVAPKQRARRGTRKQKDRVTLSSNHLEKLLFIARQAGDKEMVALLSPKRPLTTCKRELIASIRHNRVDQELWIAYVEAINAQLMAQTEMMNNSQK